VGDTSSTRLPWRVSGLGMGQGSSDRDQRVGALVAAPNGPNVSHGVLHARDSSSKWEWEEDKGLTRWLCHTAVVIEMAFWRTLVGQAHAISELSKASASVALSYGVSGVLPPRSFPIHHPRPLRGLCECRSAASVLERRNRGSTVAQYTHSHLLGPLESRCQPAGQMGQYVDPDCHS
jgi:hypothetical protein